MEYYVYVLLLRNGTVYVGSTWDIRTRLAQHLGRGLSKGGRHIGSRKLQRPEYRPVRELVSYRRRFGTRALAERYEEALARRLGKRRRVLGGGTRGEFRTV